MVDLGASHDLVHRLGYLARYNRDALVYLLARHVPADVLREALRQHNA